MSTKIGGFDSGPVHVNSGRVATRSANGGTSAASTSDATTSDTQITDSARTLAALDQQVKDLPAIDQARVDSVSSRLADGSYEINAERIADKLLKAERDLSHL